MLWHTRLYLGHHLQPEEFSLLHQKPLDVFLLRVSSFASRRGAPSPSWGNALPAPAGLWLFLPQDAGGGTYWLQTCGKCLSHASTLHSVVIFASENDLCPMSTGGFPAQQGDFPATLSQHFLGGSGGQKGTKRFLYTRASLLPKTHTLEGVYLQAAQSQPWHCTCSSTTPGPRRGVDAELRTGSSLGWGHPQRDGSSRGVGSPTQGQLLFLRQQTCPAVR